MHTHARTTHDIRQTYKMSTTEQLQLDFFRLSCSTLTEPNLLTLPVVLNTLVKQGADGEFITRVATIAYEYLTRLEPRPREEMFSICHVFMERLQEAGLFFLRGQKKRNMTITELSEPSPKLPCTDDEPTEIQSMLHALQGIIVDGLPVEVVCTEKVDVPKLKDILARIGPYMSTITDEALLEKLRNNQAYLSSMLKATNSKGENQVLNRLIRDGRLHAKGASLQLLKGDYRKALTCALDEDIDIANCHPVLLNHILQREGIAFPLLCEYVNNREDFMQHGDKFHWIKIINGAGVGDTESQILQDFKSQRDHALKQLFALPKFQKLYEHAEKYKKKGKQGLNTAVSMLLCNCERECATLAMDFLKGKKYHISASIYDGFHVKRTKAEPMKDKDLRGAETYVKENSMYRFDIRLVKKSLGDYNSNLVFPSVAEFGEFEELAEDDDHANAQAYLNWMQSKGHRFVRTPSDKNKPTYYWYDPSKGIWARDWCSWRNYASECPSINETYKKQTRKQNMMLDQIHSLIPVEPDWTERVFQGTLRKLAFQNGVYDFDTKTLLDFSPEFYFTFKAPIDYVPLEDICEKVKEEVKKTLFDDIVSPENTDYWLRCLSRAMAGECADKVGYFLIGEGNSGLGCTFEALKGAFGSFVAPLTIANLENPGKGEQEKLRAWMISLQAPCRIALSDEMPENKFYIDSGVYKTLTGGGAAVRARGNYEDSTTLRLMSTLLSLGNWFPNFTNFDTPMKNRVIIVPAPYRYYTAAAYEAMKHEPNVRRGREDLKDVFLRRTDVLCAFASLVINAYGDRMKVPEHLQKNMEELTEQDDVAAFIKRTFKPESKQSDKVIGAYEFKDEIKAKFETDVNDTRLGKMLTSCGFKRVEYENGKKRNVLFPCGIRGTGYYASRVEE